MEKKDLETKRITRRQLLVGMAAGAATVAAAACGGGTPSPTAAPAAPAPASGGAPTTAPAAGGAPASAPAVLKGTSLAFLGGTYFIPAAQEFFVAKLNEWGKANNVTVSADFLSWPDVQAKIAAA